MSSSLCSSKISPARKDCVCDVSIEAEEEAYLTSGIQNINPRLMPTIPARFSLRLPTSVHGSRLNLRKLTVPEEEAFEASTGPGRFLTVSKPLTDHIKILRKPPSKGIDNYANLKSKVSTFKFLKDKKTPIAASTAPTPVILPADLPLVEVVAAEESPKSKQIKAFINTEGSENKDIIHPEQSCKDQDHVIGESANTNDEDSKSAQIKPQLNPIESPLKSERPPCLMSPGLRIENWPCLRLNSQICNTLPVQSSISNLRSQSAISSAGSGKSTRFDSIEGLREYVNCCVVRSSSTKSPEPSAHSILTKDGKYSNSSNINKHELKSKVFSHSTKKVTFNSEVFIWTLPKNNR